MEILYAAVTILVLAIAACEVILTIALLQKNPKVTPRKAGMWMMMLLFLLVALVTLLMYIGGE